MPSNTREVLLTTKTAGKWQDSDTFDQQVDAIIETINQVDTPEEVARTTEVLDVYHHTAIHATSPARRRKRMLSGERPFEFLTFRN